MLGDCMRVIFPQEPASKIHSEKLPEPPSRMFLRIRELPCQGRKTVTNILEETNSGKSLPLHPYLEALKPFCPCIIPMRGLNMGKFECVGHKLEPAFNPDVQQQPQEPKTPSS